MLKRSLNDKFYIRYDYGVDDWGDNEIILPGLTEPRQDGMFRGEANGWGESNPLKCSPGFKLRRRDVTKFYGRKFQ